MTLSKQVTTDLIEIIECGVIQVRNATRIIEGENVISESYERFIFEPGSDVSAMDSRVQAVAAVVWTSEVVAARKAFLESQAAATPSPFNTEV